jgi:hypothetical protein
VDYFTDWEENNNWDEGWVSALDQLAKRFMGVVLGRHDISAGIDHRKRCFWISTTKRVSRDKNTPRI